MDTLFSPSEARQTAKYLLKFPALRGIEVVENLSSGRSYVRFLNACGNERVLESRSDLIEIKEAELVHLAMR